MYRRSLNVLGCGIGHLPLPLVACLILVAHASAQRAPTIQPASPSFIVSMTLDLQGNLWAGCEDVGVWKRDAATNQWRHFTTADGLGDNNGYAIAVDRRGRIWVGHLYSGVSVFNGTKWQNYEPVGGLGRPDSLSGPIGERVFDIAVCPTDGDVWIAGNAGISRYSESTQSWTYYTRADGLPSDQVQAIAFDASGTAYVGTQCDGIAIAMPLEGYRAWRVLKGVDRLTAEPSGSGLPSNSINDILVVQDGTVIVATTSGLAYSFDRGTTWQFVRGADWPDKVRGLLTGPPQGWTEPKMPDVLLEDYISCLAQDAQGRIWVGYRKLGAAALAMGPNGLTRTDQRFAADQFVRAIIPTAAEPIVATYSAQSPSPTLAATGQAPGEVALPKGADVPTAAAFEQMLANLKAMQRPEKLAPPNVVTLSDDWRTRGDWLGRVGRYWISLNGMIGGTPPAYLWGAGEQSVGFSPTIGPTTRGDVMRYWTSASYTADPRSLEMPEVYLQSRIPTSQGATTRPRRQTEMVDNGQAYPATAEGPDLYHSISVPEGVYFLWLYSVNDNGHGVTSRNRDNLISIRPSTDPVDLRNITGFEFQPELARARVRDFYGGVYKRFLVQGPGRLAIRIGREYSLNAKMSAIALDSIEPLPDPYYPRDFSVPAPAADSADRLADALQQLLANEPHLVGAAGFEMKNVLLARWYASRARQANDRPAVVRYITALLRSRYYTAMESVQQSVGMTPARQIERSLKWNNEPSLSGRGRESIIKVLGGNPPGQ